MTSTILNVRDFGAVGNGVTDDQPAIQRALMAACALPLGVQKLVYFPRPAAFYRLHATSTPLAWAPGGQLNRTPFHLCPPNCKNLTLAGEEGIGRVLLKSDQPASAGVILFAVSGGQVQFPIYHQSQQPYYASLLAQQVLIEAAQLGTNFVRLVNRAQVSFFAVGDVCTFGGSNTWPWCLDHNKIESIDVSNGVLYFRDTFVQKSGAKKFTIRDTVAAGGSTFTIYGADRYLQTAAKGRFPVTITLDDGNWFTTTVKTTFSTDPVTGLALQFHTTDPVPARRSVLGGVGTVALPDNYGFDTIWNDTIRRNLYENLQNADGTYPLRSLMTSEASILLSSTPLWGITAEGLKLENLELEAPFESVWLSAIYGLEVENCRLVGDVDLLSLGQLHHARWHRTDFHQRSENGDSSTLGLQLGPAFCKHLSYDECRFSCIGLGTGENSYDVAFRNCEFDFSRGNPALGLRQAQPYALVSIITGQKVEFTGNRVRFRGSAEYMSLGGLIRVNPEDEIGVEAFKVSSLITDNLFEIVVTRGESVGDCVFTNCAVEDNVFGLDSGAHINVTNGCFRRNIVAQKTGAPALYCQGDIDIEGNRLECGVPSRNATAIYLPSSLRTVEEVPSSGQNPIRRWAAGRIVGNVFVGYRYLIGGDPFVYGAHVLDVLVNGNWTEPRGFSALSQASFGFEREVAATGISPAQRAWIGSAWPVNGTFAVGDRFKLEGGSHSDLDFKCVRPGALFKEEWAASRSYAAGDYVRANDYHIYGALVANTGQDPISAPDSWKRVEPTMAQFLGVGWCTTGYLPANQWWDVGSVIFWRDAAPGAFPGELCTAAGFNPSATWAPSTFYGFGVMVANGERAYFCVAGGTSAANGGPTGAGSSVIDGTVVWKHIGSVAIFKAMAPLAT